MASWCLTPSVMPPSSIHRPAQAELRAHAQVRRRPRVVLDVRDQPRRDVELDDRAPTAREPALEGQEPLRPQALVLQAEDFGPAEDGGPHAEIDVRAAAERPGRHELQARRAARVREAAPSPWARSGAPPPPPASRCASSRPRRTSFASSSRLPRPVPRQPCHGNARPRRSCAVTRKRSSGKSERPPSGRSKRAVPEVDDPVQRARSAPEEGRPHAEREAAAEAAADGERAAAMLAVHEVARVRERDPRAAHDREVAAPVAVEARFELAARQRIGTRSREG